MREYETTFVVQPEISEEGRNALLAKLDSLLVREDTARLELHDHGKRKLAYEIQKFQKGHYLTLVYLDDGRAVPDLERALRLEESVLRYLTIQVGDEIEDTETRKAAAAEHERVRLEKAAERAAREAEERAAREAEERAAPEAEERAAPEAAAPSGEEEPEPQGEEPEGDDQDERAAGEAADKAEE